MEEESRSELKQDRISNLPDCLIHHILSFLPSTKQAIQTTVLSNRWHKQWTGVPVLIFNSNCTCFEHILKFHNCFTIKKLHCKHDCLDFFHVEKDLCFDELVSFATRRHVEDLKLHCSENKKQVLPEIFFYNISLLALTTYNCKFMPKGKVNWARLKELYLVVCRLSNEAVEHILSGSPLLESIELSFCRGFDKLVIASNYLKRLVLKRICPLRLLEIICPQMKELSLRDLSVRDSSMFDQAMKNALLVGPLLESLELVRCGDFDQLAIASKSLKRLVIVLGEFNYIHCLRVSCTKLEKLEVFGKMNFNKVEFMHLPSLVRVNLDFEGRSSIAEVHQSLIGDILWQLHYVNELKLGRWFLEVLSALETRDRSPIVLYTKCLTLDILGWSKYQSGVAFMLKNSPTLEKLVITNSEYEEEASDVTELSDFQEKNWNSTATVFNCSVSHLRTVEIIGIPVKVNERMLLLNFVKFLLKNVTVLETITIASVRSKLFKVFSRQDGHKMQFQSYEKQIDDYICSK